MTSAARFDAFISYSHGASGVLAQGLQRWLQAYAKPWWKRRAIGVFRDETDLSAAPALWNEIEAALEGSDWLILIATRQAAASKWVKRELRFWLGDREPLKRTAEELDRPISNPSRQKADRLLIVVADGEASWNDGARADFDWSKTTVLPRCLSGVFEREPLWLDLRQIAGEASRVGGIGGRDPQFMNAVARLSSRIRGLDLSLLIGEDARQHRRTRRIAASAVAALAGLTLVSSLAAWLAFLSAAAADKQRQVAEAERQVALAQSLAQRPANMPRAALMAGDAFRRMRSLAHRRIAPEWLVTGLRSSGLSRASVFSPLIGAEAYRATAEQTRSALDLVLAADELTPSLVMNGGMAESQSVSHVAFLSDDVIAVSVFETEMAALNATSGEVLRRVPLDPPAYRINGAANVARSGDGHWVASEAARDGMVRIVSVDDGAVRHTINPRKFFETGAFEPPPRLLAGDKTGPITETFTAGGQSGTPLLAGLAMDHAGDSLLLVTRGGKAMMFSLRDGPKPLAPAWTLMVREPGSVERLASLALNHSGEMLAVASSVSEQERGVVEIFGALDGRPLVAKNALDLPVLTHGAGVNALAFHPRIGMLAVGARDGTISIWNTATGARERVIQTGAEVASLAFGRGDAEGYLVVGTEDGLGRVYRLPSGREVARAPHPGRINAVAWDGLGKRFLTGASLRQGQAGDTLRVWSFAGMDFRPFEPRGRPPEFSQLATSGGLVAAIAYPDYLVVWKADTGEGVNVLSKPSVPRLPFALDETTGTATTIATDEDGLAYVYNLMAGSARIVPGPGISVAPVTEKKRFIADAAFDAPGGVMARLIKPLTETERCEVEIWSLGRAARFDSFACSNTAREIAVKPDGGAVVLTDAGPPFEAFARSIVGKEVLWRRTLPFAASTFVGKTITYSRDGKRVAVAGDRSAAIMDSGNGETIGPVQKFAAKVIDIALSSDGSLLAATLEDRTIAVSDVASGEVLRLFDVVSDTTGGGGLAFGANGELFATLGDGNNNNRKLWKRTVDPAKMIERLDARLRRLPELR